MEKLKKMLEEIGFDEPFTNVIINVGGKDVEGLIAKEDSIACFINADFITIALSINTANLSAYKQIMSVDNRSFVHTMNMKNDNIVNVYREIINVFRKYKNREFITRADRREIIKEMDEIKHNFGMISGREVLDKNIEVATKNGYILYSKNVSAGKAILEKDEIQISIEKTNEVNIIVDDEISFKLAFNLDTDDERKLFNNTLKFFDKYLLSTDKIDADYICEQLDKMFKKFIINLTNKEKKH